MRTSPRSASSTYSSNSSARKPGQAPGLEQVSRVMRAARLRDPCEAQSRPRASRWAAAMQLWSRTATGPGSGRPAPGRAPPAEAPPRPGRPGASGRPACGHLLVGARARHAAGGGRPPRCPRHRRYSPGGRDAGCCARRRRPGPAPGRPAGLASDTNRVPPASQPAEVVVAFPTPLVPALAICLGHPARVIDRRSTGAGLFMPALQRSSASRPRPPEY